MDNIKEKQFSSNEILVNTVNLILPAVHFEKPPFPVIVKEHSFANNIVSKSSRKAKDSEDKIIVEPTVAMVKDLVPENIDGCDIYFCEAASNLVETNKHHRPIVGTHVVSVKIDERNYYGLCDLGSSASAMPFSLDQEVMNEIAPCEIEDIDVTFQLANRKTISPVGVVRDVEVLCGKVKYPTDFFNTWFCRRQSLSYHLW